MYLIGSESEGTLGWAAVQIKDLQTAPAMIQTGDGSTLSDGGSGVNPLAVGAVVATLVAAAGATFVSKSRRATA